MCIHIQFAGGEICSSLLYCIQKISLGGSKLKKKLSFVVCILLVMVMLFTACDKKEKPADTGTGDTSSSGDVITLRISHVLPESHPTHYTLEDVFKPEVEKNSNGKIKVQIYPNASLGSDRQAIESVSLGSLEMTVPGGPVVSGFYEPYMIFDLPFLFPTRESGYAAWDGELGQKISEGLKEQHIINLGYGENGFRHITNNKGPINTPADMKGLKIRTMENPLHIAAFKGMSANPTPIAFGELFTALQQGTVDAQETPAAIIFSNKFYEVQKYMSLTGHLFTNCPYLINQDFYEGLSPELQKVVADAVTATIKVQRETLTKEEGNYIDELKKAGMEVNEISEENMKLFVDAVKPAYDLFEKDYGTELLELARKYTK